MLTREHSALRHLSPWKRFHVRLTMLFGGAVLVVLLLMGVVFYNVSMGTELDGLKGRLRATAITLAATLDADGLAELRSREDAERPANQEAMRQLAEVCDLYPGITNIYVLRPTADPVMLASVVDYSSDTAGLLQPGDLYDATDVPVMLRGLEEPVVEDEPVRDEWGLTISGYAPIRTSDGELLGVVGVDLQASRFDAIKAKALRLTLAIFGLAAFMMVGLGALVGRNLKQPLARMMSASADVAEGRFDTRVDLDREDEFGLLGDNFNQMAEGLQEREFIRDTFGRYMSEDVARTLLSSPELVTLGGEERDVSILISDIRGYSSISENLSPTQVVELLNEYLGAMNEVIEAQKGCVIEYLGDGILAVFGAPNDMADHAVHAVECAVGMRDSLSKLNRKWEQDGVADLWKKLGYAELRARVGLHSGNVVAGNLGSRTRMKYAVTGDTVNVAARLEQLNKDLGTEILFSSAVLERLSAELRERAVDRGSHPVKGRESEVPCFSI